MGSSSPAPSRFAIAVGLRALLLGSLAFAVAYLTVMTQLYATALVLLLLALAVGVDLSRIVTRADRSLGRFLEGLASDAVELPVQHYVEFSRSTAAFDRAAKALNQIRAERQRQLEYLEALLDTVSAALIVVRADGRLTMVNSAARRLTATPASDLASMEVIGQDAARVLRELASGARQIVLLSDGQRMLARCALFLVPGAQHRRLISLQPIVGELDAVETRAWQDMATVLAHEMMNSLTPISSLSESLEALVRDAFTRGGAPLDTASDEIAAALEAIRRRSEGLMSFVERYRKVAELPQPVMQRIVAHSLLSGIGSLMAANFSAKGVGLRCEVLPRDLCFVGDAELLEQAVINLLRNAIDAVATAPNPHVEVLCCEQDRQIMIAVRDNGIGVREEDRAQMFVPFFTTKQGGSGVGLSLARQVAVAHGGRLDVQDNHPHGLALLLVLPILRISQGTSLRGVCGSQHAEA